MSDPIVTENSVRSAYAAATAPAPNPPCVVQVQGAKYEFVDWHEAWERKSKEVIWLIEPIIEAGTNNALFSDPGVGKSLMALEFSAQAAMNGKRVLYVDNENRVDEDHVDRLQHMGYHPDDLGSLKMLSFSELPPLDTEKGGQHLIAIAVEIAAELVVIDTTSMFMCGPEDSADTSHAMDLYTFTPLKGKKIAIFQLDHSGKDKSRGRRGTSAKKSRVDTEWQLLPSEDQDVFSLKNTKSRGRNCPELIKLTRVKTPYLCHEMEIVDGKTVKPVCADTAEVKRLIEKLDELKAPVGCGRPTAIRFLKAANVPYNGPQLEAAVKQRKAV